MSSPGFDRPVLVSIDEGGASVTMAEERVYRGSKGDSWRIPRGFRTDFATIPAVVAWAVTKLGLWTLAAIVHDLLCEGLNRWHEAVKLSRFEPEEAMRYATVGNVPRPSANSIDTDGIFYKIAREYGTDVVTANLLWLGVRWGALFNPARREGFMRREVFWWWLGLSLAFVWVVPIALLVLVGRLVLRLARLVLR